MRIFKIVNKKAKIVLILGFIILTLLGFMIFGLLETNRRKEMISNAEIELNKESLNIESNIAQVAIDTTIMKNIINGYAEASDDLLEDENYLSEIKELSINWLDIKRDYDQFRVLDVNGFEVLRVNQTGEDLKPYSVSKEVLQNKSQTTYYQNAKSLNDGELKISDFNLNVENGVIEIRNGNVVPEFRLVTPLFKNNVKYGYIVFNVLTTGIINRVINKNTEIINSDGYYIFSEEHNDILYAFTKEDELDEVYSKYNLVDVTKSDLLRGSISRYNDFVSFKKITPNSIVEGAEHLSAGTINLANTDTLLILTVNEDFSSDSKYFILLVFQFVFIIVYFLAAFGIAKLVDLFITSRSKRLEKLEMIANTDELTKIKNRKKCFNDLKAKKLSKIPFSLLYLDIDSFKDINDNYGHDIGDKTLIFTCNRINKVLDKSSVLYRLGGDEFLIITDIINKNKLKELSNKILKATNRPLNFLKQNRTVSLSIGISRDKNNTLSTDDLIDKADNAMYFVKKSKKNDFAFYDEEKNKIE